MTERSAAEILAAQLQFEVAESKRAVMRELNDLAHAGAVERSGVPDALETLVDCCVKRWWVTRMLPRAEKPPDLLDLQQRADVRARSYALCTQTIVSKSGPIDAAALQMSMLGLSAELNAIWAILLQSAMVTQATRQDYMDAAAADLYNRVTSYAQKIITPGANGSQIAKPS